MYELEVAGSFGRDYGDGMSEEMRVSIKLMHKEWPSRRRSKSKCREVEEMNQEKERKKGKVRHD